MEAGASNMACFRPIPAYRGPGGGVFFNSKEGYSDKPFHVPCGSCVGCRLERSRQWAMRCVHENTLHERSCFVTLTYSDANLPADRGLDLRHWQEFAKRLRRRLGPFRYFHCGEYGELTGRPHYHAILFGIDFSLDQRFHTTRGEHKVYTSSLLESIWGHGLCEVGSVTFESAAYVARYCIAKKFGDTATAHYAGRRPEYVTMSRRPGIGSGWFRKFGDEVYRHDSVVVRGRECRPPRYYDSLLEAEKPEIWERVQSARRAKFSEGAEDRTPERLAVREVVKTAHTKLFSRSGKV